VWELLKVETPNRTPKAGHDLSIAMTALGWSSKRAFFGEEGKKVRRRGFIKGNGELELTAKDFIPKDSPY
jgi:hypothetical protein